MASWPKNIGLKIPILVCIIATLYFQFKEDPLLKVDEIKIVSHSDAVEHHLSQYRETIGSDYNGYRNHIYRVLTYSMHFLHRDETNMDVIASALVYHDIGLWTSGTLAYLEPGSELAKSKCAQTYTAEQLVLQDNIINNHHKIWPFHGENERIVEAVRKADWIDASNGILNKGMPRSHIAAVKQALPAEGFYNTLMEFGPRLHGNDVVKIVTQISKIFKW
jgi:hypothetical protein